MTDIFIISKTNLDCDKRTTTTKPEVTGAHHEYKSHRVNTTYIHNTCARN